jgi:diadenosine tetraphosphatase ApaH/serine/threonine PP2A family protein phosphatase
MGRTIFIGDVHGCLSELGSLLEKLGEQDGDRFIFVGDLVDKGPDSLGVLQRVRDLCEAFPGSVVVSGNHEEKASRQAKRGIFAEPWAEQATPEDWAFIDAMPLTWADGGVRVVHGGIFPSLLSNHPDAFEKIENRGEKWRKGGGKCMNRARRMLRIRFVGGPDRPEGVKGETGPGDMLALSENKPGDPFWSDVYEGEAGFVVYGHDPLHETGEPREADHAVGIDTGCVFGGTLTALVMDSENGDPVGNSQTVSVPAERQHANPMKEEE